MTNTNTNTNICTLAGLKSRKAVLETNYLHYQFANGGLALKFAARELGGRLSTALSHEEQYAWLFAASRYNLLTRETLPMTEKLLANVGVTWSGDVSLVDMWDILQGYYSDIRDHQLEQQHYATQSVIARVIKGQLEDFSQLNLDTENSIGFEMSRTYVSNDSDQTFTFQYDVNAGWVSDCGIVNLDINDEGQPVLPSDWQQDPVAELDDGRLIAFTNVILKPSN
ncbi:hypothetical protein AB6D11_18735 [Vibrio splendidus]